MERLIIGGRGDDVARHDLVDWKICDVCKAIFHRQKACQVLFMLHQFIVSWEQFMTQIRVCDSAPQLLLAVHDYNIIQMVAEHKPQNLVQRRLGADGDRSGIHQFKDFHFGATMEFTTPLLKKMA